MLRTESKIFYLIYTLGLFAIVAATLAFVAITPYLITSASAKITSQTTNTGCTNNGGGVPQGQQPTCQGNGLTQQTTTQNVNPAGSAPPGQNK